MHPDVAQAYTGGLGTLMTDEYRVWLCIKSHPCLAEFVADDEDLMCYIFNEMTWAWRPWGVNSDLSLVDGGHAAH